MIVAEGFCCDCDASLEIGQRIVSPMRQQNCCQTIEGKCQPRMITSGGFLDYFDAFTRTLYRLFIFAKNRQYVREAQMEIADVRMARPDQVDRIFERGFNITSCF